MNQFMEYKGYHARIEYSAEDETFVGRVIGITDTLLFDGGSVEELTDMFHQSVDDYLASCAEIGKAPEKEYRGSFNVRLSPELHRRAAIAAEGRSLTLNQFMNEAVKSYLQASP